MNSSLINATVVIVPYETSLVTEVVDVPTSNNNETTATASTVTTTATTESITTTKAHVTTGVPIVPSDNPPYHVITPNVTEDVTNATILATSSPSGASPALIGIIAGVVISLLILCAIVAVIIFIIFRRRRKESKNIPQYENPQYKSSAPRNYRFSRDSTLNVAPTVNFTKLNNKTDDDSLNRKKRPAPSAPSQNQHLLRKKGPAPPPPNPFGNVSDGTILEEDEEDDNIPTQVSQHPELYEKDSNSSSENIEMSTFTRGRSKKPFSNETSAHDKQPNPVTVGENDNALNTSQHSESKENHHDSIKNLKVDTPLEDEDNNNDLHSTFKPKENIPLLTPSKNNKDPSHPTPAATIVENGQLPSSKSDVSVHSDEEDPFLRTNDADDSSQLPMSKENAQSNTSLDDYDKTLNPFFS